MGDPGLGCCPKRMPNRLARRPHAKWRGTPVCVGGVPGAAPVTSETKREREQAALRRVTLTELEGRSRSGGEQWRRKANDG
jgi:hypothetical protein